MNPQLSIWAPVVLASFPFPRSYEMESSYPAEEGYKRIDDIRVKIKNCQVEAHGKGLEMRINLEIICLLEDTRGRMLVVKREETLQEKIPLGSFDRSIEKEKDLAFIMKVEELNWDGDLTNNQILLHYYLSYLVYAVREQLVQLVDEKGQWIDQDALMQSLQHQIDQLTQENGELRRKIFFFERDILSLRRGIQKTETRNFQLTRLIRAQETDEEMEAACLISQELVESEGKRARKVDQQGLPDAVINQEMNLGQKIKRLFLNSGS